MTEISGVVSYRARIPLPSGAVVRVRLEDTARQDTAAPVLGETEIVTSGEQVPIPFALDADLSAVAEHARLALRATIDVEGQLRFVTTTHAPFSFDHPDEIELLVELVPAPPTTLGDTEWLLVELDGEPLQASADDRAPSLVLDLEEAHVTGSGGVNRLVGSFVLNESELRFGPLAGTMMAGAETAMARERAFLDALAKVTSYELDGRTLALLADDDVVVRLAC